jgi:hypothetical protein
MTEKWEYKLLQGVRKPIVEDDQPDGSIYNYENELTWSEDGKRLENPIDIYTLSNNLGLQGWELVTILPRSLARTIATKGTTTEEVWVYKRTVK